MQSVIGSAARTSLAASAKSRDRGVGPSAAREGPPRALTSGVEGPSARSIPKGCEHAGRPTMLRAGSTQAPREEHPNSTLG